MLFYEFTKRMQQLCEVASKNGLKLLVDAEYTYMNPGISAVALAMMFGYNKERVVVANTYQCYLRVSSHVKKCSVTDLFKLFLPLS